MRIYVGHKYVLSQGAVLYLVVVLFYLEIILWSEYFW